MPSVPRKVGKRCLEIIEREISRKRTGFEGVVAIAAEFSTKFQAVLAAQITVSILVNVALRRVHVLAANAKKWRYRIMAAEVHGREAVIGKAGNSKLWG